MNKGDIRPPLFMIPLHISCAAYKVMIIFVTY